MTARFLIRQEARLSEAQPSNTSVSLKEKSFGKSESKTYS